jgi:hypothetical protein
MTAFLPPMLLELFRASAPVAHVPDSDLQTEPWNRYKPRTLKHDSNLLVVQRRWYRKYKSKMVGIANYLQEFEKNPKKAEGRMVEPRQYRKERKVGLSRHWT